MPSKYSDYLDGQKERIDQYKQKVHSSDQQNKEYQSSFIKDSSFQTSNPQENMIFTFGREQKNWLNNFYTTPPQVIHSKKQKIQKKNLTPFLLQKQRQNFILQKRPLSRQINEKKSKKEMIKMRDKISEFTYSIKTIESRNNEEIGISSQRVLMSLKNLQQQQKNKSLGLKNRNYEQNMFPQNILQSNQSNKGYQSQRIHKNNNISKDNNYVSKNRFISRPLNVIIREKTKQLQTKDLKHNYLLFQNQNGQQIQEMKQNKIFQEQINPFKKNKIKIKKLNLQKLNLKRQFYQTKQNKKIQTQRSSEKEKENHNKRKLSQLNIQFQCQQKCKSSRFQHSNQKYLSLQKKVSLSNFLSQYQNEIIQSSPNILSERKHFINPLKNILKRKMHCDLNMQENLYKRGQKFNKLSHNLCKLKQKQGQIDRESHLESKSKQTMKKFKTYKQIQKYNLIN